ncbi:MAG TPA: hypothetical protein VHT34_08155 [Clostridia bacterium]|nr:hypothetical protein [Clostridia bacterium]
MNELDPLDNWTLRTIPGITLSLRGTAFGNGKFMVDGLNGVIATSQYGDAWSVSVAPSTSSNNLFGAGFYNGKYIAVGRSITGGRVSTSIDAANWADTILPSTRLNAVTYGISNQGGGYVAVGDTSNAAYSPDLTTWTVEDLSGITLPTGSDFRSAAFGINTFVITGTNGGILMTPDGLTWARISLGNFPNLNGITFANGKFIAVGGNNTNGIIIASSDNGLTWPTQITVPGVIFRAVTYANGFFVAAGSRGAIWSSPDGINWSSRVSGITGDLYGITFGRNTFLAVGDGGRILQSGVFDEHILRGVPF